MADRTALDDNGTILDSSDATLVDTDVEWIISDSTAGSARSSSGLTLLPESLATRFKIVEIFPASGAQADLYLVEDAKKERCVAKVYRPGIKPKEDILEKLLGADAKHIVKLLEYGHDDGRWWELLEYIEQSNLRALIDQETVGLSAGKVREVVKQLNAALTHLHQFNIEHRDLKPENVLVRTCEPLDLVLADFGISSVVNGLVPVHFTGRARSIKYAPPESIGTFDRDNEKNVVAIIQKRVDYWSLGMMIVEMLTATHPFDKIKEDDEVALGFRLLTMDVDGLVEGVTGPTWRKLCRGLLRRDPTNRWGGEQVARWLMNPEDRMLMVQDEAPPRMRELDTFRYAGKDYATKEALAEAFDEDWGRAADWWKGKCQKGDDKSEGHQEVLKSWLKNTHGLHDVAERLTAIDRQPGLNLDAQIFSMIRALNPAAPLRFKGLELTCKNLEKTCKEAIDDVAAARGILKALYTSNVLSMIGGLPNGAELEMLGKQWQVAVREYEHLADECSGYGATVPGLDDKSHVTILAASIPVTSILEELRRQAELASTVDARECPWFRVLGSADKASVASLLIIPYVVKEAEAGAKQRHYDIAVRDFGYSARILLGTAAGLIVGGVTAYVPGFIVYYPISWIYSEETATTIAMLWVLGIALAFGLSSWIPLQTLVGNTVQNTELVRLKGAMYSLFGMAVIGYLLYYQVPLISEDFSDFEEQRRVASLNCTKASSLMDTNESGTEITLCSHGGPIFLDSGYGRTLNFSISPEFQREIGKRQRVVRLNEFVNINAPMTFPGSIAYSWRMSPRVPAFKESGLEYIKIIVRASKIR